MATLIKIINEPVNINEGDFYRATQFIEIIDEEIFITDGSIKKLYQKREPSIPLKREVDMIRYTLSGKFIDSDLSINASQTKQTGADFNSNEFGLEDALFSSITLKAKGANAGSSGKVTFNFVSYNDALALWDTTPFATMEIDLDGINVVAKTIVFSSDVWKIKLFSIANGDNTYGITANAAIFIKK